MRINTPFFNSVGLVDKICNNSCSTNPEAPQTFSLSGNVEYRLYMHMRTDLYITLQHYCTSCTLGKQNYILSHK